MKSRLSRGLEKLRARLVRRGVEVSTCVLGAVLVEKAAAMSVAMPPRLATSTVKAALWFAAGKDAALGSIPASVAAVAESVSKPLLLSKLMKIGAVVLLALGALATIGAVGSRMSGGLDSADSAKLSHPRTETSDAKLDKLVKDVAELRSEVRAARPHDPFTPPPVEAREETRDFKNARVEVVVKSIFDLEDGVAAGKRKDDAASLRVQKLMAELALAKEELERRMNGLPETVRRAVEKYQERMTELREANQRALDGQQVRGVKKKLKRAEKAKMWIWAAEVRAGMLTEADARRWMDRDEIEEPKPKLLREVRK